MLLLNLENSMHTLFNLLSLFWGQILPSGSLTHMLACTGLKNNELTNVFTAVVAHFVTCF